MADIFGSYTRADQEIVRSIVSLLEAQGWSVWWDTRWQGTECGLGLAYKSERAAEPTLAGAVGQ